MTTSDEIKLNQLEAHLKLNIKDNYGAAIVVAALFLKLYGRLPKIGLSGAQADAAQSLFEVLPDKFDDPQLKLHGV